tara:strand:+ start:1779 stop:3389 length:1611 start_codon:yes stop_codon:yes gene_type:complete
LLIKYYLLLIFLLFFGRSFIVIFSKFFLNKKSDEIDIHGINIYVLYPIVGLFILGNLLFLINFFLPLKSNFSYLVLLFLLINIYEKINSNFFIKYIKYSSLSIFLLASSYNVNFHYDAGLYHLNNQLWLRESNIVQGFSNIYGAFGVSSIHEYLSAFFWFDESFILLHFINLIFIGSLYSFLIFALLISKENMIKSSAFFILIYSLLDNFGISGGRNGFISIQSVGKQDVPIAILFLITSIFILISLINKKYSAEEVIIYSIFSLFLYQLKVSGVTISFLYLIYIFYFFKSKNHNINKKIKILALFFLLFVLWTVKTLFQTGCLVFPLARTCFSSLSWVNKKYLKTIEEVTVDFSFSYDFKSSFFEWFQQYMSITPNYVILLNFSFSLIALLLLKLIFFKAFKTENRNLLVLSYVLFNIIFYLRFGPDSRYLMGTQLLVVAIIGLYSSFKYSFNDRLIMTLIVISIFLVPRLDSYRSFDFFSNPKISLPVQEMETLHGRLFPNEGDQCWVNINCSANKSDYKIERIGFFNRVNINN